MKKILSIMVTTLILTGSFYSCSAPTGGSTTYSVARAAYKRSGANENFTFTSSTASIWTNDTGTETINCKYSVNQTTKVVTITGDWDKDGDFSDETPAEFEAGDIDSSGVIGKLTRGIATYIK